MNIRPVFVFDGPDVPPKRGGRAGRIVKYEKRALLKQILHGLGVPYIEAPGEAEAECCRLQVLKLVDAVWSVDSDCLMFGCTLWIRDSRTAKVPSSKKKANGDTQKDQKLVRVVRSENLQAKSRLKREGCVLFAMMAGGDYGTGLFGCGSATALMAAQSGLGISLCRVQNQAECKSWRDRVLLPFFAVKLIKLSVPANYPRFDLLQWYNNPTTHSDDYLRQHAAQSMQYDLPIREPELLQVALPRLNMTRTPYLTHIGPVLLSRRLSSCIGTSELEHILNIKFIQPRTKSLTQGQVLPILERKLTFCPNSLTTISSSEFDNWKPFKEKNLSAPYDPAFRVACEVPIFLLRRALPAHVLDPPASSTKKSSKRKDAEDLNHTLNPIPAKKTKSKTAVSNKVYTTVQRSPYKKGNFIPTSATKVRPSTPVALKSMSSRVSTNDPEVIVISDSDDDFPLNSP
ncbi:hypothetical protein J1614_003088 [Plenodomus biglobosus]|nr:hypothetical protein J1614_003088 [Plenodomus biglobosus]